MKMFRAQWVVVAPICSLMGIWTLFGDWPEKVKWPAYFLVFSVYYLTFFLTIFREIIPEERRLCHGHP